MNDRHEAALALERAKLEVIEAGQPLQELRANFIKRLDDKTSQMDVAMAEADGVMFLCPVCFKANGGSKGTHSVICWRPHVPQTVDPKPGRWEFKGTGIDDLTLFAGSSSIKLDSGCQAHFFVVMGKVVQ